MLTVKCTMHFFFVSRIAQCLLQANKGLAAMWQHTADFKFVHSPNKALFFLTLHFTFEAVSWLWALNAQWTSVVTRVWATGRNLRLDHPEGPGVFAGWPLSLPPACVMLILFQVCYISICSQCVLIQSTLIWTFCLFKGIKKIPSHRICILHKCRWTTNDNAHRLQ